MGTSSGPSASNFKKSKLSKVWTNPDKMPGKIEWIKLKPYDPNFPPIAKKLKKLKVSKKRCAVVLASRTAIASFNFDWSVINGQMIVGRPSVVLCPALFESHDELNYYISGQGSVATTVKYNGKWWCLLGIYRLNTGLKKPAKWFNTALANPPVAKTNSVLQPVYILHEYNADTTIHEKVMNAKVAQSHEIFENAIAGKGEIEEIEIDQYGDRIWK
jgi:hypothetical protein